MKIEELILKWALKNALDHGGKALQNAVLSKIIREDSSLKTRMKELLPLVEEIVNQVNSINIGS
jgi:glutamyl-tRNA synthetase